MEYRQLGRSGMRVSQLCLGTMNFGSSTDEAAAIEIVDEAIDAGINFIDTADVYARGVSEEMVGKALAQNGKRDEIVLATNPTTTGEATALHIADAIGDGVTVTRLASGLPVGADLEHADEVTLGKALAGRRSLG